MADCMLELVCLAARPSDQNNKKNGHGKPLADKPFKPCCFIEVVLLGTRTNIVSFVFCFKLFVFLVPRPPGKQQPIDHTPWQTTHRCIVCIFFVYALCVLNFCCFALSAPGCPLICYGRAEIPGTAQHIICHSWAWLVPHANSLHTKQPRWMYTRIRPVLKAPGAGK